MLKILSIGNSFSEDAHRYLYGFAHNAGEEIYTCDYVIGGCPLEKHWNNFVGKIPAYYVQENGEGVRSEAVLNDILTAEKWDVVTIQQVSHFAGRPETYEPFLGNLVKTIRELVPTAKLFFQETWEYEYNSTHGEFPYFHNNCNEMFEAIKKTVHTACDTYGLTIIPSGEAIHEAKKLPEFDSEHGGLSLYRDGFHMGLVYGRFLLASVWYKAITGKSPLGNDYLPTDGDSDPQLLKLLEKVADTAF